MSLVTGSPMGSPARRHQWEPRLSGEFFPRLLMGMKSRSPASPKELGSFLWGRYARGPRPPTPSRRPPFLPRAPHPPTLPEGSRTVLWLTLLGPFSRSPPGGAAGPQPRAGPSSARGSPLAGAAFLVLHYLLELPSHPSGVQGSLPPDVGIGRGLRAWLWNPQGQPISRPSSCPSAQGTALPAPLLPPDTLQHHSHMQTRASLAAGAGGHLRAPHTRRNEEK